ncbi:DNA polymerase epsilon subunit B [Xylaria sp. CBS 124048]|nr:DNA polymerase epsilon subunit B [Xylaria sp. CBS 124048]
MPKNNSARTASRSLPKTLDPATSASNLIPSSSPAFGTPAHTLKPFSIAPTKATILPILLPPATLRPLAFRTFTKKHSLTLTSTALRELATFVGRHCGAGWREEGLAEKVLEEVARSWRNRNGGVIVDGDSQELKDILKTVEGNMTGGKVETARELNRQTSSVLDGAPESELSNTRLGLKPTSNPVRQLPQTSFGMSSLAMQEVGVDSETSNQPRNWLKAINAFDQPRMLYNISKKHFERDPSTPSLVPPASHKTTLFRNRYNVIHQRLLRNESFQSSAVALTKGAPLQQSASDSTTQQTHKITPIANLLGRHGTHHMLLGMLSILPTGNLAINDLTGTISLDISHAVAIPEDSAWFTPGMIILVDGVYEEEEESVGKGLGASNGIGGVIGGRFQAFFVGQPPCEKRKVTLGVSGLDGGQDHTIGGGFGWIDFLGVGSERAVGSKMRRLEQRLLRQSQTDPGMPRRGRIIIVGELNLDQPRALEAFRKILTTYASEPEGSSPMAFVLTGNFTQHAVMAGGGASGGSVEYKEYFDSLASILSDFPTLLQNSTFVFVPGDNDGWASSFSSGSAVPLPRKAVPELFTSRVRRVFTKANTEASADCAVGGEAIWASNPARLSVFGPTHDIVLFRDDISARLRRTAVRLKSSTSTNPDTEDLEDEPPPPPSPSKSNANASQNHDDDVEMSADMENIDSMDVDVSVTSNSSKPNAPDIPHDVHTSRKLVKTILDQGFLCPFRQAIRPVHWDYAGALHLYPLPTALVLVDPTAPPFTITYEGCHVMNPGPLLVPGRRGVGRWIEYELGGTGRMRECIS